MSTPPAGQPPASTGTPPADPEASRIQGLDERFNKIEHEQTEQRGMLEQILGKVSGATPTAAGSGGAPEHGGTTGTGAPADIGEMMRQAVRDVGAEQAAADAKSKHDAEHERIAAMRHAEHAPRERRTPWRARIQQRMWGIDEHTLGGQ